MLSQPKCWPRMKSQVIFISYIALPHVHAHSTGLAPLPTALVPQNFGDDGKKNMEIPDGMRFFISPPGKEILRGWGLR